MFVFRPDVLLFCLYVICRYQGRGQTRLIYAVGHCLPTWNLPACSKHVVQFYPNYYFVSGLARG